jgi:hypothetical protein
VDDMVGVLPLVSYLYDDCNEVGASNCYFATCIDGVLTTGHQPFCCRDVDEASMLTPHHSCGDYRHYLEADNDDDDDDDDDDPNVGLIVGVVVAVAAVAVIILVGIFFPRKKDNSIPPGIAQPPVTKAETIPEAKVVLA